MKTSRRDFIKKSSGAILGASAMGSAPLILTRRAYADDQDNGPLPTLVCVYLRGGADPLNTIVPFMEEQYYRIRPTIAIPKPGLEGGCMPITNKFGFHPSLSALHDIYRDAEDHNGVAAIINVGSPHPTRSHFDAQDFMEYAAPGVRTITDGWLNRYLQVSDTHHGGREAAELRGLAMQPLLPRSLRGEYPVLAVPEGGHDAAIDAFESLYMGEGGSGMGGGDGDEKKMELRRKAGGIVEAGQNTIRTLRRYQEITRGRAAGQGYPTSGFARRLQKVATVIKANCGLEVASMDYGGWDHHTAQGGSEGRQANMLKDVSDSIAAFLKDLGPRSERVLVLTMSEFGRTVKENGNNGSDHGHGGFMLAAGGMVTSGMYGTWTGLEMDALYESRDMPVHTDFRVVFTEVLYRMWKFRAGGGFFPDWEMREQPLGFLKQV